MKARYITYVRISITIYQIVARQNLEVRLIVDGSFTK